LATPQQAVRMLRGSGAYSQQAARWKWEFEPHIAISVG